MGAPRFCFFFQAEDGIRDVAVTGVQTCALPICERQLDLLERQRQTLTDLLTRRQLVEDQIESCVLAMQNVRFDLLRLRSAGVAAVLDDLPPPPQQARAPSPALDPPLAPAGGSPGAPGGPPRPHGTPP